MKTIAKSMPSFAKFLARFVFRTEQQTSVTVNSMTTTSFHECKWSLISLILNLFIHLYTSQFRVYRDESGTFDFGRDSSSRDFDYDWQWRHPHSRRDFEGGGEFTEEEEESDTKRGSSEITTR